MSSHVFNQSSKSTASPASPSAIVDQIVAGWQAVQDSTPLVQCLTNTVVQPLTANVLIAGGAAPAMVDVVGEAEVFAAIASGVLINLGTVAPGQQAAMPVAAQAAHENGTPWVLDPVAIGALPVRTNLAHTLTAFQPTVVRGNASEIIALSGGVGGRGVDSTASVEEAADAARAVAEKTCGVVAVSGEVDLITDGSTEIRCVNGSPMLTQITGAGCSLGAYITAFVATIEDPVIATAAAHVCFGIAGERAAQKASGPGTFGVYLLDEIANLNADIIRAEAKLP
ncbi:MAG: hydroxyethylthiazole kinase [Actinomycetaceae bacterium]|nr:hydroxyethylthiazole kinase [Actinomycetaceae bacterium]